MEVRMNNTKAQGATKEAARHVLQQSKREQQTAQNEQEFAMFAMSFFASNPLTEVVESTQLATVKELSDFLETIDENDPEYVPDEIMKITMRGQDVVSFMINMHDLMTKILKQQTNGDNTLPTGPSARA